MLQLGFVAAINLFCSPLSVVFCFQARFCVGRSVHRDYPEFDDTLEGPQFADQSILDYVRLLWPTALCELNSTFTDAVKNFIQVLYLDQTLHLKCLEVQCTGRFMCTSDMYASPGTCV